MLTVFHFFEFVSVSIEVLIWILGFILLISEVTFTDFFDLKLSLYP